MERDSRPKHIAAWAKNAAENFCMPSAFVRVRASASACVRVRASACVRVHPRASAYVRVRPHASACIRVQKIKRPDAY